MLPALASALDAEVFGLDVSDAALARASVRVRAFTGQEITAGTSTVTLRGPSARLPQRPVTSVVSVLDEDGNTVEASRWEVSPGGIFTTTARGLVTVTYAHGYETVPEEVLEVVCTIGARLGGTSDTVAAGVTQEQSGSASQTFGWDAWRGMGGLTVEEKSILTRLFPRLPAVVVLAP